VVWQRREKQQTGQKPLFCLAAIQHRGYYIVVIVISSFFFEVTSCRQYYHQLEGASPLPYQNRLQLANSVCLI
jgi:hypothetical protein